MGNRKAVIAFQGALGANSDMACRDAYPNMKTLPCGTFIDAFRATLDGESELAMIPIENSITTYNPLSYEENPDFKKSYWQRRDNALNSFTGGDENINEHYYIAGFIEKFDYEQQKILGLNTPYVNFVINKK